MTPALLFVLAGPLAGFVLSVILWLSKRTLDSMTATLNDVNSSLTELRVEVPKNYVTKQELLTHMEAEESWHENINTQLNQIREEIRSIRVWHQK
jgi:hypothetical protein